MHRSTERRDALRERVFAGRRQREAQRRRAAAARKSGRRMMAVFAALAMVAGVLTATQLASSALEEREGTLGANECEPEATATDQPATAEEAEAADDADSTSVETTDAAEDLEAVHEDGHVHWHSPEWGDEGGESPPADCGDDDGDPGEGGDPGDGDPGDGDPGDGDPGGGDPGDGGQPGPEPGTVPPGGENGDNNGLDILGRDCTGSDLSLHTGFQSEDPRCVNTQAGEVSAAADNPSLLITDFPDWVEVDEPFELTVSTRNLLRDRFLGAGDGGYYLESSFLTPDGIQRGHFHLGCVNLVDGNVAPDPSTLLEPQFFGAVEDSGGGAGVSSVTLEIPGLPEPGLYRCMAWAGDPSHRVPMMSLARQQIAVDVVRITVTEATEG